VVDILQVVEFTSKIVFYGVYWVYNCKVIQAVLSL